jgi:hypothetical protein
MLNVKSKPTLMLSDICKEFEIVESEARNSFLIANSNELSEILNVSEEYLNLLSSAILWNPEDKRYINEYTLVSILRSMGYEEYVIILIDC